MDGPHGLSLVDGRLPVALQAVGLAVLAVALARRSPGFWTRRVPACAAVGVAGAVACLLVFDDSGLASEPAPGGVTGSPARQARELCALAAADGIACTTRTRPAGHTWTFAAAAFADALPWLADRVLHPGTARAVPPPAAAPRATTAAGHRPGHPARRPHVPATGRPAA